MDSGRQALRPGSLALSEFLQRQNWSSSTKAAWDVEAAHAPYCAQIRVFSNIKGYPMQ